MRFEWDEEKNLSNQRKHGVSFEEASQIFRDPLQHDVLERVVDGEQRWLTLGQLKGVLILAVAHTIRELESGQTVVRIISARYATKAEKKTYAEENG